jgi:hypothetical protein
MPWPEADAEEAEGAAAVGVVSAAAVGPASAAGAVPAPAVGAGSPDRVPLA